MGQRLASPSSPQRRGSRCKVSRSVACVVPESYSCVTNEHLKHEATDQWIPQNERLRMRRHRKEWAAQQPSMAHKHFRLTHKGNCLPRIGPLLVGKQRCGAEPRSSGRPMSGVAVGAMGCVASGLLAMVEVIRSSIVELQGCLRRIGSDKRCFAALFSWMGLLFMRKGQIWLVFRRICGLRSIMLRVGARVAALARLTI